MNVLHVIQRYFPYVGGAELVFQELGKRLVLERHTVTVYTTDAWDLERFWRPDRRAVPLENELYEGVFIERFPVEYLPFSRLAFPAIKRLMALLADLPGNPRPLLFRLARYTPYVPALDRALDVSVEPFQLVHTANISLDSAVCAAYRFARRRQIPFVLTPFLHLGEEHSAHVVRYYTLPHQVEMLKRADAVIVMTEREGKALAGLGVASARIHEIGAGVDEIALAGGDAEHFRLRYDIAGPIVAYLGTAAYDKGTQHLVEAMTQVWRTHEATLVLAGSQMSAFETWFNAQPDEVRSRTRVLGFIAEAEKRDLLAALDVLVMPSRTDSFGIVYLEAWLYDKPVIGARAGGVPDVIRDGENGFLVKFGDTDEIARRIIQLLDDPFLALELGQNGHALVQRSMTVEQQYTRLRDLYRSLI